MVTPEGESDVNIEVMLWYRDEIAAATSNHNWHVHVSSVDGDDCATANGHYNPFNAPVSSAVSLFSAGLLFE